MLDWVLNTPLFIDGYYLHALTNPYIHMFVPECSKSFYLSNSKLPFLFGLKVFFLQVTITRYFINYYPYKKEIGINWRKKFKPLADAALHIFF